MSFLCLTHILLCLTSVCMIFPKINFNCLFLISCCRTFSNLPSESFALFSVNLLPFSFAQLVFLSSGPFLSSTLSVLLCALCWSSALRSWLRALTPMHLVLRAESSLPAVSPARGNALQGWSPCPSPPVIFCFFLRFYLFI